MREPKNIREWLNWAIENQEGLKEESTPSPFPEWNKGYLEALNDCKEKIIFPIDKPMNDRFIDISIVLGMAISAIHDCLECCDLELLRNSQKHINEYVDKIFYGML